jgi:hypothetical protein
MTAESAMPAALPFLPAFLFLVLAAAAHPAIAGEPTVLKCVGEHGELVYTSSRAQCPGAAAALAVRGIEAKEARSRLPAPTVAAKAKHPLRAKASSGIRRAEASSWRCQSGQAVWYQHQPCARSAGKIRPKQPVRGERVTRSHACREISRPAALLRRGSEHDERAGPYERAVGRDPCR